MRWLRGIRRSAVIGVTLAGVAAGLYFWVFAGLPPIDDLEAGLALPSTEVLDRHGRLLYEIIPQGGGRHSAVPLDQIARCMVEATVATEDARFYEHPGFDPMAIARALWANLTGGEVVSGASTITQQVVRNLLLDPDDRSLRRKLREVVLAVELTAFRSRDDIMELYLNQSYYGNLAYGVEAAARTYFGKSAAELDLAECAMLAGLPQAPAMYDPLSNPEAARERQRVVLDLMVRRGFISQEEADMAAEEPLRFAADPFPIRAPHFVMAVWAELEERFREELRTRGLVVTTTLDLDWQERAGEITRYWLEELNTPRANEPSHNAHNAALVALDPYTGEVLTMLGSPDYFDERIDGAVNAALAPRQPGSTIKPFTYAAAMEPSRPDPWTAATMLWDVRTAFVTHDLESYVPVNFSLGEHGPVMVREALASSYNIPAVIALDHIGTDTLARLMSDLGVTTLADSERFDLALTLGGGEVRLLELTAAYAAFANGGHRVEPILILEVRDHEGNLLYRANPEPGPQVIDERVAWLITDILSDNAARTPTFGPASPLRLDRPAAAKTGTTTDFRDAWTVGYTPDLVVGVWVGNADGSPMYRVTGSLGAAPIWHRFMLRVMRGRPELEFERPPDMIRLEVCAPSGMLPTPECPHRALEWFIPGTEPTEYDTLYRAFTIDTRTGLPATDSTPPEYRTERVYMMVPPHARDWALRAGIPLPPEEVSIASVPEYGDHVRLMYPDPYTVYRISATVPREHQRIRIEAWAPRGTRRMTFILDGEELETLEEPPWEVWWTLNEGRHTLIVEAELADGTVESTDPLPFTVNGPDVE